MLRIENLHVQVGDKKILNGFNLTVPQGEIHVIMGPNGIGKSTLGHALMGNKNYKVSEGNIYLNDKLLNDAPTHERAKEGLFLAFQYPVCVPGLKLSEYFKNLYTVRHGDNIGVTEFRKILNKKMQLLDLDKSISNRYLNEGFSGGEMKRLEMLQLSLMEPKVAILDEIDSGVDVDAQRIIADSIMKISAEDKTSFVIITHYQRLLNFLNPHRVHVILDGKIAHSGGLEIVTSLENEGFDFIRRQGSE